MDGCVNSRFVLNKMSMCSAHTHVHASMDGGTKNAAVVKTLSRSANAEPMLSPKLILNTRSYLNTCPK